MIPPSTPWRGRLRRVISSLLRRRLLPSWITAPTCKCGRRLRQPAKKWECLICRLMEACHRMPAPPRLPWPFLSRAITSRAPPQPMIPITFNFLKLLPLHPFRQCLKTPLGRIRSLTKSTLASFFFPPISLRRNPLFE